jgi:lipopolysaccharide heptosyltransferase I
VAGIHAGPGGGEILTSRIEDTRRIDGLRDLRPGRVCLIKPSALGDVVNALPVLSALRGLWPDARISWVVNGSLRGLLDGLPELDEVIPLDRGAARPSLRGAAAIVRFLSGLRSRRFDVAIDLQGLLRSGIMAAASGAPVRVGLADAREGGARFYTHRVIPPGSIDEAHAVDRMLSLAAAFGADVSAPRFVVACDEADRAWARRALADVATPRLVLNLGARWPTKRWPPEHFAEVARRAIAARGAGLVAVGAPEDRPLVEALRALLPGTPLLDLSGRTTLPQLSALAAEADVFLSNDTGPLHLAAAAGARVVGVYTCTSPRLNGPYGPRATAVQTGVWCAASYVKTCRRLECFAELTPDRVWPVVLAQLDAGRDAGASDA